MPSYQRKRFQQACAPWILWIKVWKTSMKDAIDSLPFNVRYHGNISVTTYKLTATIKNKVFTYKQTVVPIELDEGQSLDDYIYSCNCGNSKFCDPDNVHIITRDLRLIINQKSRKLFAKDPNFRESQ